MGGGKSNGQISPLFDTQTLFSSLFDSQGKSLYYISIYYIRKKYQGGYCPFNFLLEGSSPFSPLPRQLTPMSKSYVLWRKTDNTLFYSFPGAFIKSCIRTNRSGNFEIKFSIPVDFKKNNGRLISSKWFTNNKNIILWHSILVGQRAES